MNLVVGESMNITIAFFCVDFGVINFVRVLVALITISLCSLNTGCSLN